MPEIKTDVWLAEYVSTSSQQQELKKRIFKKLVAVHEPEVISSPQLARWDSRGRLLFVLLGPASVIRLPNRCSAYYYMISHMILSNRTDLIGSHVPNPGSTSLTISGR